MKDLHPSEVLEGLASVPQIPDAVPPTIATFESLLQIDPSRTEVRLALATLLLGEDRPAESLPLFEQVLATQDSAIARCNLGAAYVLLGRHSEALVELAKAVLMDSSLVAAHLQLARVQRLLGDSKAGAAAMERVVAFQPRNAAAICELAALYLELGGDEQAARATQLYQRALSLDPNAAPAQIALGRAAVVEGVALFKEDRVSEACSRWGEAYRRYPRAFSGDPDVQKHLKECVETARRRRIVAQQQERVLQCGAEQRAHELYRYVLYFLLSESLIPECFEEERALVAQRQHWEAQTSKERVFPYAHYRLSIVEGYLGRFEQAAEQALYARDYIPASKHRSLRIEPLASFFREARDLFAARKGPEADGASADSWAAHGFEDPFSQQAWRQSGCTPAQAAEWRALGLRAPQASEWREQGITAEEAADWLATGSRSAAEVRRWLRAGIDPFRARQWQAEFSEELSLAIQCVQLGFSNPKEARGWLEVFLFPYEAIAWKQTGFTAEEAKKWMKSGIKDPFLARQQRDEEEAIYAAARAELDEDSGLERDFEVESDAGLNSEPEPESDSASLTKITANETEDTFD